VPGLEFGHFENFLPERSSLVLAQARNFDWNLTAEKVLELYRRLL
jgi:hypothetical protein